MSRRRDGRDGMHRNGKHRFECIGDRSRAAARAEFVSELVRLLHARAFDQFQAELDAAAFLMEDFTNIKGATVDEVGMLSCAMDTSSSPCILNGPTPVAHVRRVRRS